MSESSQAMTSARPPRLLVVPHIPAADIRVREIELARRLRNHFESVYSLRWSDALGELSGGPIRRRWRQASRAIGSLRPRQSNPEDRDGVRYLNVPVLQPILLRRVLGNWSSLRLSRRVNSRWVNRVVEEHRITHVLLATSNLGIPNAPGVKTFFDFVDWFPEERASAAEMNDLRRDLKWLAGKVQGFFAVSEPLAQKLHRDYRLDCAALPNGTDVAALRAVSQAEVEQVRTRWNAQDKYVIGIIGNHGDYVPLDFAVQVLRRVRSRMPDSVLWIVGPAGNWRGRLEGEPGVLFTGQVPPDEVGAYFQAIDLGWLVQERSAGTEFAFQIKVVEYTACRKFVMAPPFETWRRLSWPNVRLLDFDPDAWAAEVCSLRKAPWTAEWDRIVESYDWNRLAAQAAQVILQPCGD